MKLDEFKIGGVFYGSAGFAWLCTDKGTRTITAIRLDPDKKKHWFKGPPYLLTEEVFDENEMQSCYTDESDMLKQRLDEANTSAHPGFLSDDVFKMFDAKKKNLEHRYPHPKVLRIDRVAHDGKVWHPYGAVRAKKGWDILIFELFSREFSSMHEEDFVKLRASEEFDLIARKAATDIKS